MRKPSEYIEVHPTRRFENETNCCWTYLCHKQSKQPPGYFAKAISESYKKLCQRQCGFSK